MGQLAGKRILTFGDSIIAGHLYEKAGFVEFAAEQEGMKVVRFARNGACILPGRPVDEEGIGGMILTDQIARAAKEGYDPDYVVFNGGNQRCIRVGDRPARKCAVAKQRHGYFCRRVPGDD